VEVIAPATPAWAGGSPPTAVSVTQRTVTATTTNPARTVLNTRGRWTVLAVRCVTDTAVGGLPPAQAGVAGAITSTARQFGAALGRGPAALPRASHPGRLLVAACGLLLVPVALASRPRSRRQG
jgi:hypothetical protein